MKHILTTAFLFISIFAFGQIDCDKLPSSFSSYEEAINTIQKAKFTFKDEVNTSKSSWIRSASFYSCDKRLGYLIITTDTHSYIHKNLPLKIWYEFKDAASFGNYYNQNIKGRYQF